MNLVSYYEDLKTVLNEKAIVQKLNAIYYILFSSLFLWTEIKQNQT